MTDQAGEERTFEQLALEAHAHNHTVEEAVTDAIRKAILAGIFRPGDRLPQQYLASRLMVSRTPVAEALHTLQAEGLVVYAPHRGATVRILERAEIEEAYQLRILLETFVLRMAIERITPDEIEELVEMAQQIDAELDEERRRVLTEHWYEHLYYVAHCPLTAAIVTRLRANVGRYWLGIRAASLGHSTYNVLAEAIRARDSTQAERWISEHLTRVSADLQERVSVVHAGAP